MDAGGHLLYLERMDNTFAQAAEVSHQKARTAALFKKETKSFEDNINGGRVALTTVGPVMLQGGLPIIYKGDVIGASASAGPKVPIRIPTWPKPEPPLSWSNHAEAPIHEVISDSTEFNFCLCTGAGNPRTGVGNPTAVVDLRKTESSQLVKAQWRSLNAKITPATFHAPGPSVAGSPVAGSPVADKLPLYPTGKAVSTFTLEPRANTPAFEQATWETVAATDLEARRGNGLLSHVWYRTTVTLPSTVGKFP